MSAIEVRPASTDLRDANCSVCLGDAPRPTLLVLSFETGPHSGTSIRLCEDHAHSTINALGFVYCSKLGISVAKLLGVDKPRRATKRKAKP